MNSGFITDMFISTEKLECLFIFWGREEQKIEIEYIAKENMLIEMLNDRQ